MSKFRMLRTSGIAAACLALTGAVGCAGDESPPPQNPGQYGSQMQSELAAERQEFIQDKEQQIQQLDNRISQIQSRLDNETQYVGQSQINEWQNNLFEVKLEKERAQAQLQRARQVTPEQFQEMRGPIETQFDRLEAATDALTNSIAGVFGGGDEQQPVRGEEQQMEQQEEQLEQQEEQLEEQQEQMEEQQEQMEEQHDQMEEQHEQME